MLGTGVASAEALSGEDFRGSLRRNSKMVLKRDSAETPEATPDEFIPPSVGGIVGCGPCCLKGNKASLLLNTVEPSVPQVPLWDGFIDRICLFKHMLVCPGELLQAGNTIYRLPRRQKPISWPEASCADPG